MIKSKSLFLTAILSLVVSYAKAVDVTVDFSAASDASPTTATVLNSATNNGAWTEPTLSNLQTDDYFRTLNKQLDFDINSDIAAEDSSASINATTELSFTNAKNLDGTVVTINLAQFSRGGAGSGGAYFIGKDSDDKELFKIFLSCGQKNPGASTITTGLRRGVAYVNGSGEYVTVTTTDDVMQYGGVYTVTLSSTGYLYSGDPDAVAGASDAVTTPTEVSYNTAGVTHLKKIELVAFNDAARSGMQFDGISVSGSDYDPTMFTATATFSNGSATDPAQAADLNGSGNSNVLNCDWSDPIGNSGTSIKIANNLFDVDYNTSGGTYSYSLNLDKSVSLDGSSTAVVDLSAFTRGNSGEAWASIAGYDSSDNEAFKFLLSCGERYDSEGGDGPVYYTNFRYGAVYLGANNIPVVLSASSDQFKSGAVYTATLGANSYNFQVTNGTDTVDGTNIPYNSTVSNLAYLTVTFHKGDGTGTNPPAGLEFNSFAVTGKVYDSQTPAIGFEAEQVGTELTWEVSDERDVKHYLVVDADSNEVLETVVAGEGSYSTTLPEGVDAKIIVVDNSGFRQTYLPEDGSIQITVYDLEAGWNLIAVTGDNADLSAFGIVWGWNGQAYETTTSPKATQAVWVYSAEKAQVLIESAKTDAQITLESGWNMVGPTENCAIPAGSHAIYTWNEIYENVLEEADALVEGVGYWIFSL